MKNSRVSHIVLTKDGRKVIIGGSIHVGYHFAKNEIQNNIDDAYKDGALVFREGISFRSAAITKLSHWFIVFFLNMLDEYYMTWVKARDGLYIEREIKFSGIVETVDMKNEVVTRLAKNGFARYWPLFILLKFSLFLAHTYPRHIGIASVLFNFLILRGGRVFMDERNVFIAEAVNNSENPRIYVHYGDGHSVGIRDILLAKGWQIEKEYIKKYLKPLGFRESLSRFYSEILFLVKHLTWGYFQHLHK